MLNIKATESLSDRLRAVTEAHTHAYADADRAYNDVLAAIAEEHPDRIIRAHMPMADAQPGERVSMLREDWSDSNYENRTFGYPQQPRNTFGLPPVGFLDQHPWHLGDVRTDGEAPTLTVTCFAEGIYLGRVGGEHVYLVN